MPLLTGRIASLALALAALAGCATVPGESVASFGQRRDISAKVIARASQGRPDCKRVKIADTEILDLRGDGSVAAERWVVERCEERVNFRVTYPGKGRAGGPQVGAE